MDPWCWLGIACSVALMVGFLAGFELGIRLGRITGRIDEKMDQIERRLRDREAAAGRREAGIHKEGMT